LAKYAFDELKFMIDRAVDREELDDVRRMILEETDLTFAEKENLSNYLELVSKKLAELRANMPS
jgi:hypothetical protein